MNILDINEIDVDNSYFHFTLEDNLESITKNGLIPVIGNNAANLERTPKIFFSVGASGTLQIIDAWIRWRLFKNIKKNNLYDYKNEFITGKGLTSELIETTYIEFYDYIKNCTYLKLDLEENIDFSLDDIDEIKAYFNKDEMLKKMYGPYSNINSSKMEKWNMHTFSNHIIPPTKINIIKCNESFSALDIIKELSTRYTQENLTYLNNFLEYIKEFENTRSY